MDDSMKKKVERGRKEGAVQLLAQYENGRCPKSYASLAYTPASHVSLCLLAIMIYHEFEIELNFQSRKALEAPTALPPKGVKTGHKSRSRPVIGFYSPCRLPYRIFWILPRVVVVSG